MPSACKAAEDKNKEANAARNQRQASGSILLQQSVKETIMPGVWENLPLDIPDLRDSGQLQPPGVEVALKECEELQPSFLRKHRARRVEQFTTRRQCAP